MFNFLNSFLICVSLYGFFLTSQDYPLFTHFSNVFINQGFLSEYCFVKLKGDFSRSAIQSLNGLGFGVTGKSGALLRQAGQPRGSVLNGTGAPLQRGLYARPTNNRPGSPGESHSGEMSSSSLPSLGLLRMPTSSAGLASVINKALSRSSGALSTASQSNSLFSKKCAGKAGLHSSASSQKPFDSPLNSSLAPESHRFPENLGKQRQRSLASASGLSTQQSNSCSKTSRSFCSGPSALLTKPVGFLSAPCPKNPQNSHFLRPGCATRRPCQYCD
ncbi:56 kDa transmembrane [Cryptosporidium sp. chipmunk genotype I]|uniref:56 kDa transmembrane n=1 Tax=Cryptosporidium sp. chipmunk genotype I TaxID=1280935 RepID=UPI00351A0A42|nr:56 kDa transmembrane [Cryptosporidium sp. chipmunk genotype I]